MELDMTKGKPANLIVKFIVPIIIGNIFQQLYSMIDTIIVGQYVGVQALAAVGATGTINFLMIGFLQGLTTGFTVLTAQRFGAGDYEAMKKSVGSAIMLSVIATILVTLVCVTGMEWMLTVLQTPSDIYDMSKTYITIICWGVCCNILYNLLASILRALGNSRVPLYFLIVSALLNIALDLLFIRVYHMGVAGAAYATVIAQGIAGTLCFLYIIKKVPMLKLTKEHWKVDVQCMKIQLGIGIPMALQFSITAVGTMMVQAVLNLFGSMAVAGYTAAMKIEQLAIQPFMAMGMTMATYSAQNRGINDITRVKKGVKVAKIMSVIYSIIIFIVAVNIVPYAIRLFVSGDTTEILGYAKTYLMISGVCYIPLGYIFICRNALQGCGYAFAPMMGGTVELVARGIFSAIAAYFMSFEGVCVANVSAWVAAGIYLAIEYRRKIVKAHTDQ
ncbi:MAG: MATE family efflux transporter [Eubacteriales bacterium]